MEKDTLLEDLGKLAREEEISADPRWSRLAEGTLSGEEAAALEVLVRSSPEAAELHEVYRPLDDAFLDRAVEQAMAAARAPALPQRRAARTWPSWTLRATGAVGSLAAGVGLVVYLLSGSRPLPGFTMSVEGGTAETRGPAEALGPGPVPTPVFQPGSRPRITLRPATGVSGPVEGRCFLARGAELRDWAADAQVSQDGAVRFGGEKEPLRGVPAGRWTLVCAVGRLGKTPASPDAMAEALRAPAGGGGLALLQQEIELREAPGESP